ncbi:MAG: hypothetical protein V7677_14645, partial [Motiliproteus sp.]
MGDIYLRRIFITLIAAGFALNIYIFSLPYNTIADEDTYITQVMSLISGNPEGWNIRSFFYPLVLTPAAFITKLFSLSSWTDQIFALRLQNWISSWICLFISYHVAKRVFDNRT